MSTFQISSSQKQFIISSIKNNLRIDGRSNQDQIKIKIQQNVLDHLLGSCLIHVEAEDNNSVKIYTGIKVKVQKIDYNKNHQTTNIKNIKNRIILELGCIKKLNQQEEQIRLHLQEYLNKYIVVNYLDQFQKLLNIPQSKRHYLTLNIEVYLLTTPHISFLQYLFICTKTAIKSLKLPEFIVTYNQITNQQTIQTHMNYQQRQNRKKSAINYKGLDSLKIIGVIQGSNYIFGMTSEEYQSVESCMLLCYNDQKKVVGFQTLKGKLKVEQIYQIVKTKIN